MKKETPLSYKITPHLNLVEKIFLVALTIGVVLDFIIRTENGHLLIQISIGGLSITYFLMGFKETELLSEENVKLGIKEFCLSLSE